MHDYDWRTLTKNRACLGLIKLAQVTVNHIPRSEMS